MILCDYIKKITSTLSKVYHGNELVMTTDRDYLKKMPLTFIGGVGMYLGNGFTNIKYCINYKGDGSDVWRDILSEVGSRTYSDHTIHRDPRVTSYTAPYEYLGIHCNNSTDTVSVKAQWASDKVDSSEVWNMTDFRFMMSSGSYANMNKQHVYGNVCSMLVHSGWENITSLANYGPWTFRLLFAAVYPITRAGYHYAGWSNIDLEGILLPATTLSRGCYAGMFYGNSHITVIPSFLFPKNITLADRCFQDMFAYLNVHYVTNEGLDIICLKTPVVISRNLIPLNATPQYYSFSGMFRNADFDTSIGHGDYNLIKFEEGFRMPATMGEGSCYRMFENCHMLSTDDIPENLLPATTAPYTCYNAMFRKFKYLDPEILESVPSYDVDIMTAIVSKETRLKLPATTISGYQGMFSGSSISNVIKFPKGATVSSNGLYEMYKGNTSISSANLSFKTGQYISNLAFASMFENCTGLTNATINLMGGNLVSRAFQSAFSGCTNLRTANLNGVKNIDYVSCCANMFNGCSNLNLVYTDLLEWPSVNSDATNGWLNNVDSNGVLRTLKGFTIPAGTSGLPTTWSHSYPV